MLSCYLIVKENVLKKDLYYKEHLILSYTIKYPQFVSEKFKPFIKKLNRYYESDADLYQKINVTKLYQLAIDDYEYSVANGYPIHQYEVYVEYNVTYNDNCALSLYFDRYEYTGGAHGMTNRSSDNWNLRKGTRINLMDLFPDKENYGEYIQDDINQQIENDIKNGNNMFFEDYTNLVRENFNPKNFYLTEDGVVIYFQLYEIAPYVSGIQTFTIPYSEGAAVSPKC